MPSSTISVLVSTFHPFPTLSFSLPKSTLLSNLPGILSPLLALPHQSLSTSNGKSITPETTGSLSSLLSQNEHASFLSFRLVPKVLGGKGGFGSQLRAAGGRMSSQKVSAASTQSHPNEILIFCVLTSPVGPSLFPP
jgi:hypothetical protein